VFRPDGDWFGHANHARTPEMIPFDRYRSPDSFDRRAGIERAVERHLGALTPDVAADVLRDRATHPWPNASNVANLAVLNAAIVHPVLAHALAFDDDGSPRRPSAPTRASRSPRTLPRLRRSRRRRCSPATPCCASSRRAKARAALHALTEERSADARDGFAALLAETPPVLDPLRLAIGAAAARFVLEDFAGAADLLAASSAEAAPAELRIYALSLRALCADRLGQREEAAALHRATLAVIDAHPEWNVFEKVAALAREGSEHALVDRKPELSVYVLRLPF
jgi:hypothetical protein